VKEEDQERSSSSIPSPPVARVLAMPLMGGV
jgi:hypothetical protein